MATDAPPEVLAQAVATIGALAERLASYRHGGLYRDFAGRPDDGYPASIFDHAPLLGRSSPIAPPLTIEVVGHQVVGTARFGHAYEGPPGCVHGGFIAACFDDVLSIAQTASMELAVTAQLSVRYLAPTPLGVEVRFVATVVAVEGRKILTHGELFALGVCTAEADGLFVMVGRDRFRTMTAGPGDDGPDPPDPES